VRDRALDPAAHADFPAFRELAKQYLASVESEFWAASFLPSAIEAAARHKEWADFDEWRLQWERFPQALRRGGSDCTILNLVGMRALDEKRLGDAEDAMKRLLVAAEGETFLSNEAMSGFPKRLRAEGLFGGLCDQFDKLVKAQDWRLLDK
jgi:hypothetical protein